MIEIDASMGYGQVLRTAVALSAITCKPVKIYNIRIRRPKPGLMPQHLKGVLEAAKLSHADIKGAKIGSTSIEFRPKKIEIPENIFVDIGTAGSVTLLLQTILPIVVFSHSKTKIRVIGGTDVRGAPTVLYYQKIFFYYLKKMGVEVSMKIRRHGFYPKGGGEVIVEIDSSEEVNGLKLVERGKILETNIWSIATLNLRKAKVAERQIDGFRKEYKYGVSSESFAYVDAYSTGTSLFAEAVFENCKVGVDALGERGKRAENVGKEAANELNKSVESGACLDRYMSDQIIPYIALARGSSEVTIEEITEHVDTNIKTCEQILGVDFHVEKKRVIVKGIGV